MACGAPTCTVWTMIRFLSLCASFACFAIGYIFHSRSDPCLALEPKYAIGSHNCGKKWISGLGKAFGIWIGCSVFMGTCYLSEKVTKIPSSTQGKVCRFFARLLLELVESGAIIVSSVAATEASGHVAMKNCKPLVDEQKASIFCIVSVLFMMLVVRSPCHYGVFDIIYATFLSIMLGLGKTNLLGMFAVASICCSYRVLVFIVKEIKRSCFGYVDTFEQLIDTAHKCVTESHGYLNDVEANLPGGGNEPEVPLNMSLRNLREQLNHRKMQSPRRKTRNLRDAILNEKF